MAALRFFVGYALVLGFASCNEVNKLKVVSSTLPEDQPLIEDDPHCKHHIHKFYQQLKCQPELSPGAKCPTSYKCARLQDRNPDMCYYAGQQYPVGTNLSRTQADFHTPCVHSCQCVRKGEWAEFSCSQGTERGCRPAPGCRHFSFLEEFKCCERGITSCSQGKDSNVTCVYDGRSFSEGELFLPSDDITCTQCICAAGFNGTLTAPYCKQTTCALEQFDDTSELLTRGCIPVYLVHEGCCPVRFRCPLPTDRVIKPEKRSAVTSKTDKKCHFGNLTMEVGDHLSPWLEPYAQPVNCSCRVPPMASCVLSQYVLTEERRKQISQESLDIVEE